MYPGSASDFLFLHECRYVTKVLPDVNPAKQVCPHGSVALFCSDSTKDMLPHEAQRIHPAIFKLAKPGGPLRFVPSSPIGDCYESIFSDIAFGLKETFPTSGPLTTVLIGHYPCGMAGKRTTLTAQEQIHLLIEAKLKLRKRLTQEHPDLAKRTQIVPKMHVAWQNGRQRTYFLDWKNFLKLYPAKG